jgi:hypothetical protein
MQQYKPVSPNDRSAPPLTNCCTTVSCFAYKASHSGTFPSESGYWKN